MEMDVVTEDRWEILGAISSVTSAFTSLVAIPFVAVQLRSSNRIAKAQLINELERDIALHSATYTMLTPGGKWYDSQAQLGDEDTVAILKYISFFERVNAIVDTGVLDLPTIDLIFAGRFFYLFNNPHVTKIMTNSEIYPYVTTMRGLYAQWYAYRKARNLPIPLESPEASSHGLQ
jgi:hypothetical protein